MILFENSTIRRRLRLTGIAWMAIFALIAGLATVLLLTTAQSANLIVEQNLALTTRLNAQQARLMEIHTDFLRVMTAQAAGNNPNVDAKVGELKASLGMIGRDLEGLRSRVGDRDRPEIDHLVSGLSSYAGTIDVVASMLSLDFSSAAGMVPPFEQNYATLLNSLKSLVDAESQSARNRAATTENTVHWSIGVMLLLTVLSGALSLWVQNNVSSGIQQGIDVIAQATERLAREDLSVDPEQLARSDELQSIVAGLAVFRANIRRVRELMVAQSEAQQERAKMLDALAQEFDRLVHSDIARSTEAAKLMRAKAAELSASLEKSRLSSQISDDAAGLVSSNVQTVAATIGEFGETTQEIVREAEVSARRMDDTLRATETAQQRVVVLQEAADRIGSIVKLIANVASQTNLLALNATIEAARAGEAGKGFAVVAGEVKLLANQTAKATDEIRDQITAIQTETEQVREGIGAVSKLAVEVSKLIAVIVQGTEQQNSAIGEISESVNSASRGVTELRQQVAVTRGETEASDVASQALMSAANQLNQLIDLIDDRSRQFTAELRLDAAKPGH